MIDNNSTALVSRDGETKIVCLKHMEEYFKIEGFIPLEKSYANLLYKFFNNKILRKIKIFFILFFKTKYNFRNPKHSKIFIFDCQT